MNLKFWPNPLLAIETSCDETSVAVLSGRDILSNHVASQIDMHIKWGGVVPEAAARTHVQSLIPVLIDALNRAGNPEISAVVVTNRPGLIGALSVGVSAAKALALAKSIPILGVHHLEGHILSPLADPSTDLQFPHISLVVSGGHTELVRVNAPGEYKILGETRDDAAGEAFDKGARLLGLGYPGGKAIQDASVNGNPNRYKLPRSLKNDPLNFSFSGLKTAMLRLVQNEGTSINVNDAAASLQEAIVDVLVEKAVSACLTHNVKALTLVGGVSANNLLRARLFDECQSHTIVLHTPPIEFCTDNAAMIGLAGSLRLTNGERSTWDLECFSAADL